MLTRGRNEETAQSQSGDERDRALLAQRMRQTEIPGCYGFYLTWTGFRGGPTSLSCIRSRPASPLFGRYWTP